MKIKYFIRYLSIHKKTKFSNFWSGLNCKRWVLILKSSYFNISDLSLFLIQLSDLTWFFKYWPGDSTGLELAKKVNIEQEINHQVQWFKAAMFFALRKSLLCYWMFKLKILIRCTFLNVSLWFLLCSVHCDINF